MDQALERLDRSPRRVAASFSLGAYMSLIVRLEAMLRPAPLIVASFRR